MRAGGTPAFGVAQTGDRATLALVVVSADGVVRSIHGRVQAEVLPVATGAGLFARFEPEAGRRLEERLARAVQGEVVSERYATSFEGRRHFEVVFFPMRVQEKVEAVAVVFRESSSQFERELERKILREALDACDEGLVIFGARPGCEVIFHNHAFCDLAGVVGPLIAKPLPLPGEDARTRFERAVGEGRPATLELTMTQGEQTWIREFTISPIHGGEGPAAMWVGVLRDVTRRRVFEAQVRRAAALDAMGRLAAGAAHDFNNLLAAMTMEVGFLREVVEDVEAKESLESLDVTVQRARQVIGRLLAMTRPGALSPTRIDLRALVLDTLQQAARVAGPDITVELAIGDEPVWLFGDAIQLEQALHNLVANAAEASRAGGVVRVELTTDSEQAQLRVIDRGAGMSSAVAARAFEPLFTTKGTRGTGLGLTTVEGVVKAHGGVVELRTAPTLGTTVTLTLPRFEASDASSEDVRRSDEFPMGAGLHVLLVEDQPILRAGIARTLERKGYRVTPARDGEEALERLSDDVAVVLSDVVMPGMDGIELARRLRARENAVPVLLMSGFRDPVLGEIPRGVRLLPKPFRASALYEALQKVLEET